MMKTLIFVDVVVLGVLIFSCARLAQSGEDPERQPQIEGSLTIHGLARDGIRPVETISTPTTLPTPIPTPLPQVWTNENYNSGTVSEVRARWYGLLSQFDWDIDFAAYIIWCESNGNPWAVNSSSGACSLWQHLPCYYRGDPVGSTYFAYEKYSTRGWQPWESCY